MLDIKFIREHSDLVKDAARKKHLKFNVSDLLELDKERRQLLVQVEEVRKQVNGVSEQIAGITNDIEREEAITASRKAKEGLKEKEERLRHVEKLYRELMLAVPNIPDPSVPEGKTDEQNLETRTWGEKTQFDFEPKDHVTLMQDLEMVDAERGAKVSGFRGVFFRGDAVKLQMAIWMYAIAFMQGKGFDPMMVPALVREENMLGTGWFPAAKKDVYKTQDDLYLSGTAEVPTMGFHSGEILTKEELPKKYVAFSPCYRREAGSHGKDTRGLYRLHEFNKVEQVVLCEADHQTSVALHEEITANAEEFMQSLGIPYRVVTNCGGDLGLGQVKKYDIEAWMPSRKGYGETHSASYFHDFQARRLNIRYKDEEGNTKFVHSLNNTVIATPRVLIALLENHQRADGSIAIPEALRPYFGKDEITKEV